MEESTVKDFWKHLKLGLLFAITTATLNVLNNNTVLFKSWLDFSQILLMWCIAVFFMTAIWLFNAYFVAFKKTAQSFWIEYGWAIGMNILFCLVLLTTFTLIYPKELSFLNYAFILGRLFVGIALILIIQYALKSANYLNQVQLHNEQLKTENIRTQFEVLKQQINPHFLFNALSSLRYMIRQKDTAAEEYVIKLSEIYRMLLTQRGKNTVTLKEETEFTDKYLFMLQTRFEDMLIVEKHILTEALHKQIPAFSLQLVLENCVKHNQISSESPLQIRIYQENTQELIIENQIQPKKSNALSSGFGLESLKQKYSLLGLENGLNIHKTDKIFQVKLKLLPT